MAGATIDAFKMGKLQGHDEKFCWAEKSTKTRGENSPIVLTFVSTLQRKIIKVMESRLLKARLQLSLIVLILFHLYSASTSFSYHFSSLIFAVFFLPQADAPKYPGDSKTQTRNPGKVLMAVREQLRIRESNPMSPETGGQCQRDRPNREQPPRASNAANFPQTASSHSSLRIPPPCSSAKGVSSRLNGRNRPMHIWAGAWIFHRTQPDEP